MKFKHWSMQSQIFSVILVVFAAGQGIGFLLFSGERSLAIQAALGAEAAGRAANVTRLIENAPISLHDEIIAAATSPLIKFSRSERPSVFDGEHHDDQAVEMRIRALLNDPFSRDIRVEVHEVETSVLPVPNLSPELAELHADMMRGTLSAIELEISIALDGGGWLNVETRFERPPWQIENSTIATFLISISLVMLAVFLFIFFWITRPLAVLQSAADKFGRGEGIPKLKESGPPEVRSLNRTFAKMRERISKFVTDRTMMLAALAHDLRSPMTALRVHAEMIADHNLRESIIRSTDEMSDMLDATMIYARGVGHDEETVTVDLNELMFEASGQGQEINIHKTAPVIISVRKLAMKRAFRNLIENAQRYGSNASVSWVPLDDGVEIYFDDDGPGIPAEMLEHVFDPFVRVEQSRSRMTGGHGLGLSIVKGIVLLHGGTVDLKNRDKGGLRASVFLPFSTSAHR